MVLDQRLVEPNMTSHHYVLSKCQHQACQLSSGHILNKKFHQQLHISPHLLLG